MITIQYNPEQQCAEAYDGEKEVGICQYEVQNDKWCIYHTFTDPSYGGQGIARKLVELIAAEADTSGKELTATCWYARKVLEL